MDDRSHIDEAGLERLVHAFYARVREDAELGPIFNQAIADWPEHLAKLHAFWSSVMLTAHQKHRERITPGLFERWLALWGETARELMTPEAAAALEAKAARIAESLQLALFFRFETQPAD